jgi:DinB superfamily
MPVDRSRDAPERERLRKLLERLTDADLAKPMPDGWTVAGYLGHMAFWDRRAAYLVQRWQRGAQPADSEQIGDSDVINEAAKPVWLAVPPRAAANEALAAAEAADSALDNASPTLLEQIEAAEVIAMDRAEHRAEHLDEIEAALGL